LTAENLKAGAVENVDKALDAVLAQVTSLKEKLAQHKAANSPPSVRSGPPSESGEYKLV